MFKRIIIIFALLVISFPVLATTNTLEVKLPKPEHVAEFLQEISVTIRSEGEYSSGEGSGVIVTRQDPDTGETINFVWTAAHVVDNLRKTHEVVDPRTGTKRTIVTFKDASIIQELRANGRRVGELKMDARVIRYSDSDNGEDLAILEIRKREFVKQSCVFHLSDNIPSIGSNLLHVGSLQGQMGANSMTDGMMSQHGRILNSKVYDQTTVTAFPGSSGGGVYLDSGAYIGMVTRGTGETFNLIVPIRRIKKWAKSVNSLWAIDPTVPLPNEKMKNYVPIEDIGSSFKRQTSLNEDAMKKKSEKFPFLVIEIEGKTVTP